MSVIFAIERKRSKEKQEKLRREYESLGMTKEQIREMYRFDLEQFNRDIAYRRHTLPLFPKPKWESEDKNPLLYQYEKALSAAQKPDEKRALWWLDEIEDPALYESLQKLSEEQLLLIDKLVFRGFTQTELGMELKVSQPSISQRVRTIRKELKRSQ